MTKRRNLDTGRSSTGLTVVDICPAARTGRGERFTTIKPSGFGLRTGRAPIGDEKVVYLGLGDRFRFVHFWMSVDSGTSRLLIEARLLREEAMFHQFVSAQ